MSNSLNGRRQPITECARPPTLTKPASFFEALGWIEEEVGAPYVCVSGQTGGIARSKGGQIVEN